MRTWGDELTLRAASDCFGVTIHVLTSHEANWYLRYAPADDKAKAGAKSPARKPTPGGAAAAQTTSPRRLKVEWRGKNVFLIYVSPVHYDAFTAAGPS